MNSFDNVDVANPDIHHLIDVEDEPEKIDYWSAELHSYNLKGRLAEIINPIEFKKKLETVNLLIAIFTAIIVSVLFLF